jgi:YebC/PmpR family DNA-binding regulatory protein
MSGHSHWSSIKHKKSAVDARRGKLFGKLSRAIMVAARRGSDPDANIALRHAIDKARQYSLPRDTIERAIKKGAGELEGESLVELTYEGYGPGGVAMILEAVSDNTNRTTPEVRKIFSNRGGSLGSSGATAWMFRRKGLFGVPKVQMEEKGGEERLLEIALEAGADDVTESGPDWEITCPAESFDAVRKVLEAAEIAPEVAELSFIAENELELDAETQKRNLQLMQELDDHDDVQNVYAAFTPSEEVLAEIEKG